MTKTVDIDEEKIPLKLRLKAWWKGYDVNDIAERLRANHKPEVAPPPQKASPGANSSKILWNSARVAVAQIVWGKGYCGPGGAKNVIAMSKLLAFSPKMSAIVIGAGLGGPARVLAQEFGVWITGYEDNEILATEGMNMSVVAGLEKKAPIIHCDMNRNPAFDRKYDRAYVKESLFTVEHKVPLIKTIFDQLKENSLFLITDYVIKSPESMTDPDVLDWLRHEQLDPFPVTSETLVKILEDVGFNIRINENTTEHYLEMVNEAWEKTTNQVAQISEAPPEEARDKMIAILQEAELWNRRTKVMRAGHLKVCRFLAHKPSILE